MGEFSFQSDFSTEQPVVFVDSKAYGKNGGFSEVFDREDGEYVDKYFPAEDRRFFFSTGRRSLDTNIILDRLENYAQRIDAGSRTVKVKDVGESTELLRKYFVPVQDLEEIAKRQEAVRDIYENDKTREAVVSIIQAANALNSRKHNGEGGLESCLSKVKNLVDFVENSLSLKTKSRRLQRVKQFAQSIAQTAEYHELKVFSTEITSKFFEQHTEFKVSMKDFWDSDFEDDDEESDFGVAEMLDLYVKISKGKKIKPLSIENRRQVFRSINNLKGACGRLMNDKGLSGIIDREEAKAFRIEERLGEAVKKLGDTSTLKYSQKGRVNAAERFFIKQLGDVLTHVTQLIGEGLYKRMEELEIKTNGLENELTFYYSLAMLAKDMDEVVMPTLLPKEKRYCRIRNGRVASHLLRRRKDKIVGNNVSSDSKTHAFVITGPNDGGKTTYERMVGQMSVLAQVGGYVPARSAVMSVVDGVFTSFGSKDNPEEKEGSFRAALRFLGHIATPTEMAEEEYDHYDHSFLTPYSLALLDEVAVGSDNKATKTALKRAIDLAIMRGSTTYFSTHFHPIAEMVQQHKFVHTINLGAGMRYEKPTYKIRAGVHAPSMGERLFKEAGFTDKAVYEGQRRLIAAGIIKE